jgi:hypothetical protein
VQIWSIWLRGMAGRCEVRCAVIPMCKILLQLIHDKLTDLDHTVLPRTASRVALRCCNPLTDAELVIFSPIAHELFMCRQA